MILGVTGKYLMQGQISRVHGEALLRHGISGAVRSIQGVLCVSHRAFLVCAVACAVATSAGPVLVTPGRHPGFKSDRAVLGRETQSTAVILCESRTHKCR